MLSLLPTPANGLCRSYSIFVRYSLNWYTGYGATGPLKPYESDRMSMTRLVGRAFGIEATT